MHSTIKPLSATAAIDFLNLIAGPRIFICSYANDKAEKKKFPTRDTVISNPADVTAFIRKYDVPGRACYFAVNTMQGRIRKKEEVAEIICLHADIDFKGVVESRKTIE